MAGDRHPAQTVQPRLSDPVTALGPASIVVPTDGAAPEHLRRCLASLRALDYPDYEVIVVDNRPAGSAPMELGACRVVREPRPGGSAARNSGLAAARGEIVAFTDDDVVVDRFWLRAIAERLARQPNAAAVTGLVVPFELETQAQVLFELSGSGPDRSYAPLTFVRSGPSHVRRHDLSSGQEQMRSLYATGEFGQGSNMAFRPAVLRAMGGFDVALGPGTPAHAGEDLAVLLELLINGHELAYEPRAIVYHSHRRTLVELQHQIHGYGVGFTAMLTAISLRHPQQAAGIAALAPAWLRSLRDPGSLKRASRPKDYPPALARTELLGMLVGPAAYLRSRRLQRRWG